jgi:hypothetical protein
MVTSAGGFSKYTLKQMEALKAFDKTNGFEIWLKKPNIY